MRKPATGNTAMETIYLTHYDYLRVVAALSIFDLQGAEQLIARHAGQPGEW